MRVVRLQKDNLTKLYTLLKEFGEVWAPIKNGERFVYNRLTGVHELSLSKLPNRTILPLKKLLLPPKFNMFKFTKTSYEYSSEPVPSRVVVGVHPCEIHAVNIMDRFYSTDYVDEFYFQRRNKLIIIGTSCEPDEYCFCDKTNTYIIEEGYDLFLSDLGNYYLVWIGSSKGDDIVRKGDDIFDEEIPKESVNDFIKWRRDTEKKFKNNIDLTGITDLMELEYNSEVWNELGEECLSCGQCTMVCPTCTCFNVEDIINLDLKTGIRERLWDSCVFKEYSLCAGGHNFREARGVRLKLWYTHKLKAFIGHFGSPSCVGCGRCLITCPVDINIKTVVEKLKGKEVEHE